MPRGGNHWLSISDEAKRLRAQRISQKAKGRVPWNKGLTKSDSRVAKYVDATASTQFRSGRHPLSGEVEKRRRDAIRQGQLRTNAARGDEIKAKRAETNISRYGNVLGPGKATKLEKTVEAELTRRGFRRGLDYDVQVRLCGFVVDFYFSREKVAVEADGCWHHRCRSCFPGLNDDRDARKDRKLASFGHKVIRIPEHDATEGRFDALDTLKR